LTPLRLRIDVCTYRGLRDGVPGVLDVLRRAGARATFFVAMGPDSSGLALLKLLRPSFALKMLRTRAAASYGLATAFYGTLLPAPLVGAGLPGMLRRIRDEATRWESTAGTTGGGRTGCRASPGTASGRSSPA